MADDLQAKDALEPTSSIEGQPAPASTEAQEESGKAQASKKVNLQEFPEFREFQSTVDRQRAALEQAANLARQEAAETKARLEALENAAYGKDDYGKMQLAATRAAREAEAAKRELAQYQAREQEQTAKAQALSKIADKYGVPLADLMVARDYEHAMDLAIEARDRLRDEKRQTQDQRREANRPDLGGGAPSTPSTRWDQDYDDAVQKGDSVRMMRLLREQSAKGK